jgi:hypothetical protein
MRFFVLSVCLMSPFASAAPIKAKPKPVIGEPSPPQVADPAIEAAAAAAAAAAEQQRAQAAEQAARDQALAAEAAARRATLQQAPIDVRLRALAQRVAAEAVRLPGDHRLQRFAVLPFTEVGSQAIDRRVGLVASDRLTGLWVDEHELHLVERARLAAVGDELSLQQSGAVDPGQIISIGKLTAARALIVGQVTEAGENFQLSVRIIDAETASVLVAEEAVMPMAEWVTFSADAVVLKSKAGAAFRSAVAPGWGQVYNGDVAKGVGFGLLYGVSLATTVAALGFSGYERFILYPAAKDASAGTIRERSDVVGAIGLGAAGVTAAVWTAALIDAWWSGVDAEP